MFATWNLTVPVPDEEPVTDRPIRRPGRQLTKDVDLASGELLGGGRAEVVEEPAGHGDRHTGLAGCGGAHLPHELGARGVAGHPGDGPGPEPSDEPLILVVVAGDHEGNVAVLIRQRRRHVGDVDVEHDDVGRLLA